MTVAELQAYQYAKVMVVLRGGQLVLLLGPPDVAYDVDESSEDEILSWVKFIYKRISYRHCSLVQSEDKPRGGGSVLRIGNLLYFNDYSAEYGSMLKEDLMQFQSLCPEFVFVFGQDVRS